MELASMHNATDKVINAGDIFCHVETMKNRLQATGESDEHMAVPSGYLTSTNVPNVTQVRISAPLPSLPSAAGHQYQQQVV